MQPLQNKQTGLTACFFCAHPAHFRTFQQTKTVHGLTSILTGINSPKKHPAHKSTPKTALFGKALMYHQYFFH